MLLASGQEEVTVNGWRKSSFSFSNGNCAEVAAWRKSSASNFSGNCVEAAGNWRKSSHSTYNGSCAEVGQGGTVVGVRDSKDPGGPVLAFSPGVWEKFLARVRG